MYRSILIGAVAAAAVGAGGASVALTGHAATTSGTPLAAADQRSAIDRQLLAHHDLRWVVRHVVHGTVVIRSADGYITHDGIVGHATAVSPTSITVHASDGTIETYVVTSATRVFIVGSGPGSIERITTGDRVAVAGVGTSTLIARHVLKLPTR